MKFIFIVIGVISLIVGVIGIVVPLLPTTPFLLLSAALFVRSSPSLYNWLISNRVLGEYIRNYYENREIPLRAKVSSILLLWCSILYALFAVADTLWLQTLLVVLALAISYHIISLGTTHKK